MPIFEYQCGSCGSEFEKLIRTSSPAAECPTCQSKDLRKKLSTFSEHSKTAFGAVSSSAALDTLPAGCSTCGNPDGPGSCGL